MMLHIVHLFQLAQAGQSSLAQVTAGSELLTGVASAPRRGNAVSEVGQSEREIPAMKTFLLMRLDHIMRAFLAAFPNDLL